MTRSLQAFEIVDAPSLGFGMSLEGLSTLTDLEEGKSIVARYEEIIARKDDAIRQLTALLAQLSTSSPRQGATSMASQLLLEKQFRKIPPEGHALISMFNGQDWEANLDGITQLTLSLLIGVSGLMVNRLELLDSRENGTVEYRAVCTSSGDNAGILWIRLNDVHPGFSFDLTFTIDDNFKRGQQDLSTTHGLRMVLYRPNGIQEHSKDTIDLLGSFSSPFSFPLSGLSNFYFDLRKVLMSVFGQPVGVDDNIRS
ncbi:hypothetical protein VNI00_011115 [Paramarasmius palmivorus]|uniref:Uncharacterized protein n=1 Tax=Paramarasmius palmivorus TaxID=297713 RepID=A0AAW0CD33_9AGAR